MANRKNMNRHLSRNQITPGTQVKGGTGNGGSQPPRNMMVPMAHMVEIAVYSPTISSTVMITKPIETSYDTICAAERSAARNGYFEFDAQPAMMMPYTPSEE